MKNASIAKMLAVFAVSMLVVSTPAFAQDPSGQLIGTWRYLFQSLTEVKSGKVHKPFGEKPSGYITYTKGGRLMTILIGDGRQKPKLPFKDEDRIRLFKTLVAATGTFKVEGNTLSITYDTSWNELWTGTTQKRRFEVEGNKLTIKSDPTKNASGKDIFFTIVLERVE